MLLSLLRFSGSRVRLLSRSCFRRTLAVPICTSLIWVYGVGADWVRGFDKLLSSASPPTLASSAGGACMPVALDNLRLRWCWRNQKFVCSQFRQSRRKPTKSDGPRESAQLIRTVRSNEHGSPNPHPFRLRARACAVCAHSRPSNTATAPPLPRRNQRFRSHGHNSPQTRHAAG
jgi:hypothetical protein